MQRRTITRALMAVLLAGAAIAMTATSAAADDDEGWSEDWSGPTWVGNDGPLRDLATSTHNATDGASAQVAAIGVPGEGTYVSFFVWDLDDTVGASYGAHVHVGPCVTGNGGAAGPHYNSGGPPDPDHEVWLDFTVEDGGVGWSETWVPFEIPPGAAHSVVIHALPTDASGNAGGRIACLPVDF